MRSYYVPHVRDFEGLSPYFGAHAKAAKEAKEYRMGVRIPHAREISECGPTTSRMCGTSKGCRPTLVLTRRPLRRRRNPEWGLGSRMCGRFGKWPYYVPHVRDFEGLSPYCGAHAKAAKDAKGARGGRKIRPLAEVRGDRGRSGG